MKYISRMLSIFIVLLISNSLYSQKDEHGKYPIEKPIPIIHEFPPAIQRFDSLKSFYYKQIKENQDQIKKINWSIGYIKNYASAYISSSIYYSNCDGSGYKSDYFSISYPIGIEMGDKFYSLPYPWNFLIDRSGVVLVEILKDTLVTENELPPAIRIFNIMTVRVIDDIFNSIEEDTIKVRYSHSVLTEELYKINKDVKLLFGVSNRGIKRKNIDNLYNYKIRDNKNHDPRYMFVVDKVIKDPYNILGLSGKKYQDFKKELLELCDEIGIRP